jgi:chaperone modulatory protein CbpM
MQRTEFLLSARLDAASLDAWVTAGWLMPRHDAGMPEFSDADLARAALIHDLRHMGVNDDGVSVVLGLVDQLHGLRRVLRELLSIAAERPAGAAAGSSEQPPDRTGSIPQQRPEKA